MNEFERYLSPFSWRYGSPAMRSIWSEIHKRRLWRRIWVALAEVQSNFGVVQAPQLEDLRQHADAVDMTRALEIEADIHHDLMAELKTYAEQCPLGGSILHLGATSMDIEDNADALRIRQSLELLLPALQALLQELGDKVRQWAELPVIGFTHLQPAEPTTLGYRLAFYAQDLLADWQTLQTVHTSVRGKGFKGAVGSSAAYLELLGDENIIQFETQLSHKLGIEFFPVANQTYPRRQDYQVLSALAGMGATLYKMAFDLRILQSPPIGELAEPFSANQVGSSAMPFKRNPIQAEKMDSLARALAQAPLLAWHNAAHTLLERTLDDSANRRSLLPESFLAADELLSTALKILRKLDFRPEAAQRNLDTYAPFAATERLMMALSHAGADRQVVHERLREHAMQAWTRVQRGQSNDLAQRLAEDDFFLTYLTAEQIAAAMQVDGYTGLAGKRALQLADQIERVFTSL